MTLPDQDRWGRLSPVLDELLELSASTRALRLHALHAQDPTLAAEVASLLAANEEAHGAGFLNGMACPAADPDSPSVATLQGQRLGQYTLVAPVGQGGMGSVWRARRADGHFEGEVAIKLLHLSLVGHAAARRFRREGDILARLAHPNIARLLDAGISEGGRPYLVLEMVEGTRIDQHCDTRKLTVPQRLALFADVLAAVGHAHGQLVIHRDIKPTNILVDRDGHVKLLDFGIAKLLEGEDDAAEASETTRQGGRMLTPEYAAPEQLRGEPVSTATDVYALGILLHQLLVGRHPTVREHASTQEAMRAALETEPVRLSRLLKSGGQEPAFTQIAAQRGTIPARLARQLGGDLENIVSKALRKAPSERYASVGAFADDLRRHLSHEPVSARADSLGYRARKFVRRHRGAVTAAAMTSVAVAAGLAGTVSQAHRAQEEARQAQVERDNALHDGAFANAARDLVSFLVNHGNGKPQTPSELLANAEQLVDGQFAKDPLTRARLQLMLGIQYGEIYKSEQSMAVLLKAQNAAGASGDRQLVNNVDCVIAAILNDQGKPKPALALLDEVIRRLPTEPKPDNTVLAACLEMRSTLHAQGGRPQEMLADAQAALVALGPARPDQDSMANAIRANIAEAHGRLGHIAQAIAGYESSIADLNVMGRKQTARAALRMNNISRLLYLSGQPRRAHEAAARGLEIARAITDTDSMITAVNAANASRSLMELGRYDEAKVLMEQALAAGEKQTDDRLSGGFALYGAPAWCATGDLARCAKMLDVARAKLQGALPKAHPTRGALELITAQLMLARQQRTEARDTLLRAIAAFDAASEKSPLRIRALSLLARTEVPLGDMASAAQHAKQAVAGAREVSKDFATTEWLGSALLAQAIVQQAGGDSAAAGTSLREAITQLGGALGDDAPTTREARALLAEQVHPSRSHL